MEFFSKGINAVLGGSGDTAQPTGVETIERLCDRLQSATLLDDRRDAVRALRSLSKKFKLEVGTRAMDMLLGVLERDKADVEMTELALETLCIIVTQDVGENGEKPENDLGLQFTEILLKKQSNVSLLLGFVEEIDFHVKWPAVKVLKILASNKCTQMQEHVLGCPMGISRLMDLLSDRREIIRNESVLVLLSLTKGNAQIQKIVAFENAFDRLLDIIMEEGLTDGGIVVEDCILLIQSLLKSNNLNQNFFREASLIPRLVPFLNLNLPSKPGTAVSWDPQKISNILEMLKLIRILVSPVNPQQATAAVQKTVHQCGLMKLLCAIMFSSGMPSHVLTEAINTVAEVMRGSPPNQEFFSQVKVPPDSPRPAVLAVITSMVTEKQPLELRCAALYCFQCYLLKNPVYQAEVVATLLPTSADAAQSVSAGQLLCTGLFSPDQLSVWCASIALSSTLSSTLQKEQLLRVQLAAAADQSPMSLLQLCVNLLAQGNNAQSRVALMMLLTTWLAGCAPCVSVFLSNQANMSFLTGLAEHEPDSEQASLLQGFSCLILGICLVHHPGTNLPYTKETLRQIIEHRIGADRFIDSLSFVSQSEQFTRAAKHPQPGYSKIDNVLFDHAYTVFFKQQTDLILKAVNTLGDLSPSTDSPPDRTSPSAPSGSTATVEDHDNIIMNYKELIRDQDQQLQEMRKKLEGLGGERDTALTSNREQSKTVESLLTQNAELKQLLESRNLDANVSAVTSSEVTQLRQQISDLRATQTNLETKLKERDVELKHVNDELSRSRRIESDARRSLESSKDKIVSDIEQEKLQKEISGLKTRVQERDSQIDSVSHERDQMQKMIKDLEGEIKKLQEKSAAEVSSNSTESVAYKELQQQFEQLKAQRETMDKEQEDLLILLHENNEKQRKLKERLRKLGQEVSDEEDEDEDDDDNDDDEEDENDREQ